MGYKVPYKEPIFTHLFWVMNDQTFFLVCGIDKNEMGKTEESKALQERNLLEIQSIASPTFFIWLQLICSSKCQWSHSVLISSSVTYLQPQSSCTLSHLSFQNSFTIISCLLFLFQSTYDYGRQLLQATVVLCQSLRCTSRSSGDTLPRLNRVWKQFTIASEERVHRLEMAIAFHSNAEKVCFLKNVVSVVLIVYV